jgi:hypothetical protein
VSSLDRHNDASLGHWRGELTDFPQVIGTCASSTAFGPCAQEADTLVTVPESLAPDCAVHVFVAMQTFSPYIAPDVVTKYC